MQHHGVPTRLLDWSESPLVALYFAVEADGRTTHDSEDAALWCLDPHALNAIANIRLEPAHDIPSFGHDAELLDYLPTRVTGVVTATKKPAAIIAPRPFRRLQAQLGVFTLFHRNESALDSIANDAATAPLTKLIIPSASKLAIRDELGYLQVDRLSLFPELENVASRITAKLK